MTDSYTHSIALIWVAGWKFSELHSLRFFCPLTLSNAPPPISSGARTDFGRFQREKFPPCEQAEIANCRTPLLFFRARFRGGALFFEGLRYGNATPRLSGWVPSKLSLLLTIASCWPSGRCFGLSAELD